MNSGWSINAVSHRFSLAWRPYVFFLWNVCVYVLYGTICVWAWGELSVCACLCVYMQYLEADVGYPALFLQDSLSLNLELCWCPASPRESCITTLYRSTVTGTCSATPRWFRMCWNWNSLPHAYATRLPTRWTVSVANLSLWIKVFFNCGKMLYWF